MKTLEAKTRAQWRQWLAKHHAREGEVWLVFHKKHTRKACVDYAASVEDALCFGWVDSLIRRIDDDSYARKFTPRKPGSRWSRSNKERVGRMIAAGRMTAAGMALVEAARESGEWEREAGSVPVEDVPAPAELIAALSRDGSAATAFESLPPSLRKRYVAWVASGKRPATRERRSRELADTLSRGERLGLK